VRRSIRRRRSHAARPAQASDNNIAALRKRWHRLRRVMSASWNATRDGDGDGAGTLSYHWGVGGRFSEHVGVVVVSCWGNGGFSLRVPVEAILTMGQRSDDRYIIQVIRKYKLLECPESHAAAVQELVTLAASARDRTRLSAIIVMLEYLEAHDGREVRAVRDTGSNVLKHSTRYV